LKRGVSPGEGRARGARGARRQCRHGGAPRANGEAKTSANPAEAPASASEGRACAHRVKRAGGLGKVEELGRPRRLDVRHDAGARRRGRGRACGRRGPGRWGEGVEGRGGAGGEAPAPAASLGPSPAPAAGVPAPAGSCPAPPRRLWDAHPVRRRPRRARPPASRPRGARSPCCGPMGSGWGAAAGGSESGAKGYGSGPTQSRAGFWAARATNRAKWHLSHGPSRRREQ
jgi:hypothetical protein